MFLSRALAAALAVSCHLSQFISAHSTDRQPLGHVTRIDDAAIEGELAARRVHAFSSFDLSFVLHDSQRKVKLALAPNHDILSHDAVVQYVGPDGVVRSVEPIDRMEHKIYQGSAFVQRPGRQDWVNVGWARINMRRDGVRPIFDGSFRIDGDNHHIQTDEAYRQTRIRGDPEIDWSSDDYMVVWRDSDIGRDAHSYDDDNNNNDDDDDPSYGELKRRGLRTRSPLCSSDGLDFNADATHPIYQGLDTRSEAERFADLDSDVSVDPSSPHQLLARQDQTMTGNGAGVNLASSVGSTAGCPTARKVALVGIATDCTYSATFNSSQSIRQHIISTVNMASQLYESTFNISLGIQNLTISDANCPSKPTEQAPWNVPCGGGVTIADRLNLFSAWRGLSKDRNAFWTLLSTCNTDAAVGLAWLGQLCVEGSQKSSGGNSNETIAGANVVVKTAQEWQVFAHEVGHTFGAVHDCQSNTCSDGTSTKQQCCPLSGDTCDAKAQFIMNPSTGSGITRFSPCTVGNICSAMGRNSVKTGCLTSNKDVTTISGSQCGNGIVEQGEDCDCGGADGCKGNPCCNPQTCKFTTGSSCDFANEECCTRQCKFASAGTVCRASMGSCDPAETCSGSSGICPTNAFAPNGQSCGDSGSNLACASGQCTSRNQQCKTLMGSLTTSNDTTSSTAHPARVAASAPTAVAKAPRSPTRSARGSSTTGGSSSASRRASAP
ncbi:zinc metalloprotease mde10 [Magnaporthiopsis poae ATCC 64411]|uniref:Disintegrin and metalloproteinase domain-containing protein B n=1 Tax=Magnaporthiopsis poae (strain ATCC 64411 / 73-15) TaxID=644358 RepID=A0A0C4DLJ7_MAGP6|nr:zinc metalloprotease mde10 [Magnaporthiopsis poae ATCC 64411]